MGGLLANPTRKSSDSPIVEGTPKNFPVDSTPLPPDAQKLLDTMNKGQSYSRSDLEKITGFTTKKTLNVLKSLLEINRVSQKGEGKSTYYFKS